METKQTSSKKKYELTDQTKVVMDDGEEHCVYRIRALIDISNVCKAGDLGGWIESEKNLLHEGCCWVTDNAVIFENAKVIGNAFVCGKSMVYGHTNVSDFARIEERARIYGHSFVCGNAVVSGRARVYGYSGVMGRSMVYERAQVYRHSIISGDATIGGKARIHSKFPVNVRGDAVILADGEVTDNMDYFTVGPIGKDSKIATFYRNCENDILVHYGDFDGRLESFDTYARDCQMAIEMARLRFAGVGDD